MRGIVRAFIVVLVLLIGGRSTAQEGGFIAIRGSISDVATSEPLPFATVSLSNNKVGTIANGSGEFRIRIPKKYGNDSLQISYVGYSLIKRKISDLESDGVYQLEVDPQILKEVVITGVTARSIIDKAIGRIPENYQGAPYISKGFYRIDTKKEDIPIHLSEAVFDIYYPENSAKKKLFRLDKMRAIKDEKVAHGMTVGASPGSLINSDVINNLKEFDVLNKSGLKQHDFYLDGTYDYLGTEAYQITFEQKAGMKKVGYEGKMFIDKTSLAFLAFEYRISEKSVSFVKFGSAAVRALMNLLDLQITLLEASVKVTYKRIGSKYYLTEFRDVGKILMKSDRDQFDFVANLNNHYIVTDILLEDPIPFENEEVLGNKKIIELQTSIYDEQFWDDYNIILPDLDFGETAKRINASNKSQEFKKELEDVIFKYPKSKTARVDSVLSFYNRKGLFNGNALVEYEGEIVLHKSYNTHYTDNKLGSQFRIGSTSKTFASMLVLLLKDGGKLQLQDSIGKYLPNYVHGSVTVEQLLTHQSGIPNYLNDRYFGEVFKRSYGLDELVTNFCSDSLEFEPGSKFNYTNSGYVLLSAIIEKVEGKSYSSVLKDRIFDPMEMDNSYSGSPMDTAKLAKGYMSGKLEPRYPIENVTGAGGITSTTSDLLKWSRAIAGGELLSKEKMAKLFVPRATYEDWGASYGYGWMIDRLMFSASRKHEVVYHPGTDMGFYTMFVKQPDEDITIVLLCNTSDFPRFEMTDLILDQLD